MLAKKPFGNLVQNWNTANVRFVFEGLLDLFTVVVQFFTSMMSPIALFKFTCCFVILKVYPCLTPWLQAENRKLAAVEEYHI